jgi:acid phosphatase family membrane protein YuiD
VFVVADFVVILGQNIILATALSAWFCAQILKTLTSYWKHGALNFERLVGAGGMPSSHTALVMSLAWAVGLHDGFTSSLFAVTIILASIVMYDAAGVRRAAGKQAKVINKLVRELRAEHTIRDIRLKELLGHTPLEVLAGAILGISIAYGFKNFVG